MNNCSYRRTACPRECSRSQIRLPFRDSLLGLKPALGRFFLPAEDSEQFCLELSPGMASIVQLRCRTLKRTAQLDGHEVSGSPLHSLYSRIKAAL